MSDVFIAPLEEPTVRITQTGRFTYEVTIEDGLMAYGSWWVAGQRRAERKGLKLARYLNQRDRHENQWEIRGDTP